MSDDSHVILFYIAKISAPGRADEKVQLNGAIQNPHCCSQPRAAQLELLKWKENLEQLAELGCQPPDSLIT